MAHRRMTERLARQRRVDALVAQRHVLLRRSPPGRRLLEALGLRDVPGVARAMVRGPADTGGADAPTDAGWLDVDASFAHAADAGGTDAGGERMPAHAASDVHDVPTTAPAVPRRASEPPPSAGAPPPAREPARAAYPADTPAAAPHTPAAARHQSPPRPSALPAAGAAPLRAPRELPHAPPRRVVPPRPQASSAADRTPEVPAPAASIVETTEVARLHVAADAPPTATHAAGSDSGAAAAERRTGGTERVARAPRAVEPPALARARPAAEVRPPARPSGTRPSAPPSAPPAERPPPTGGHGAAVLTPHGSAIASGDVAPAPRRARGATPTPADRQPGARARPAGAVPAVTHARTSEAATAPRQRPTRTERVAPGVPPLHREPDARAAGRAAERAAERAGSRRARPADTAPAPVRGPMSVPASAPAAPGDSPASAEPAGGGGTAPGRPPAHVAPAAPPQGDETPVADSISARDATAAAAQRSSADGAPTAAPTPEVTGPAVSAAAARRQGTPIVEERHARRAPPSRRPAGGEAASAPRASDALFAPDRPRRTAAEWLAALRESAAREAEAGATRDAAGGQAPHAARTAARVVRQSSAGASAAGVPARGPSVAPARALPPGARSAGTSGPVATRAPGGAVPVVPGAAPTGARQPPTPDVAHADLAPAARATPALPARVAGARSAAPPARPPAPVAPSTRRLLTPLVGIDPASVRVHRGARADALADAYSADAVTGGEDVVIASRHAEGSPEGLGVLAHELTHVARRRAPAFVPPIAREPSPRAPDRDASGEERVALDVESRVRHAARSAPAARGAPPRPTAPVEQPVTVAPDEASRAADAPERDAGRWGSLPAPWEPLPASLLAHGGAEAVPHPAPPAPRGQASGQASGQGNGMGPAAPSAGGNGVQAAARSRTVDDRSASPPAGAATSRGVGGQGEGGPDVDALARQVYDSLKRRLAAERRRGA